MRKKPVYTDVPAEKAIHSYYTRILKLMPYLVYWVDEACKLQGFNAHFGKLLNIFSPDQCEYNPYPLLAKTLKLNESIAKNLKLADMQVIFSGISEHQQPLNPNIKNNQSPAYIVNRDPLLDDNGDIIGAVISIIENKQITIETARNTQSHIKLNDSLKRPKILIVEDNPTAQKVEVSIFTNLNCDVDSVPTGEEALKIFKPGKYSLVIMDIALEDSSGYLIARNFREIEQNSKFHTAIIALTSYKPENVKDDCYFYKMEGVVGKPLTESQANQIIEHFIYNKENGIDDFMLRT